MGSSLSVWYLTLVLLILTIAPQAVQANSPRLLSSPGPQIVGYAGRAVNFSWTFSSQLLLDEIYFGTWNKEYEYVENTLVTIPKTKYDNISIDQDKPAEYRGRIGWLGDVSKGVAIFELSGLRHSDNKSYAIHISYKDNAETEQASYTELIVKDPSNFTFTPDSVTYTHGQQATFSWSYRLDGDDTKTLSQIVFGVYRGGRYKPICVVQIKDKYITNTNCSTGVRKSTSNVSTDTPLSTATFVLNNIDLEDEAVYSVRLVGTYEDMESKIHLVVRVPPTFLEQPKSTAVLEGSKLILKCVVEGKPRPTIRWLKDNKTLETNATKNLTLAEIKRKASGYYQCVAENEVGRIASEPKAIVDVQYPPVIDSPKKVNIIRATKDTEIRLTCPTVANPPALVQWFRKGKPVKNNTEKIQVKVSIHFDYANYTCVAKNPFGQDNVTFDLRQVGPPLHPQVDCDKKNEARLYLSYAFHWRSPKYNGGAPVLLYSLKHRSFVNLSERNSKEWKTINVTYKRTWYKFKLEWGRIFEFAITAWNKYGESLLDTDNTCIISVRKETSMDAVTKLPPTQEVVAVAPSIISPLQNKTVTKGDPIRLLCNARGRPAPVVSWSKANGIINPSYVSGRVLMIARAELSDAGKYICTATNNVSTTTVEAFVIVKLRPHSPVPLSTQLTHLSIKVHWKAPESHGYPVLMYSVHKVELDRAGQEVTSRAYHVNEDIHHYLVRDIEGGKRYKFYVTAWNTHGESVKDHSKSVTVKVQQP